MLVKFDDISGTSDIKFISDTLSSLEGKLAKIDEIINVGGMQSMEEIKHLGEGEHGRDESVQSTSSGTRRVN